MNFVLIRRNEMGKCKGCNDITKQARATQHKLECPNVKRKSEREKKGKELYATEYSIVNTEKHKLAFMDKL